MNSEILNLVNAYATEKNFSRRAPSETMIDDCQARLNVILPKQYLEFLESLGQGGFNGVYVVGISRAGKPQFLEETLEYREYGLPENLIFLENCDEWLYCLDCLSGTVVKWSPDDAALEAYATFDDYLLDRLRDAAENL